MSKIPRDQSENEPNEDYDPHFWQRRYQAELEKALALDPDNRGLEQTLRERGRMWRESEAPMNQKIAENTRLFLHQNVHPNLSGDELYYFSMRYLTIVWLTTGEVPSGANATNQRRSEPEVTTGEGNHIEHQNIPDVLEFLTGWWEQFGPEFGAIFEICYRTPK